MNAKMTLILAIVAGLAAVFLVYSHVENLRGETITVYKATADLQSGELVDSEVEEVILPGGLFPRLLEDALSTEFQDLIETTELRSDVNAGEILLFRHFDSSVDEGLVPQIPPGKKAVSIAVTEENSVAFFIKPGDLVDVLATFLATEKAGGPSVNDQLANVSTRPIVQAARVLAVGSDFRQSDRQEQEPYSSVTLLVSMEEAAKLVFARDFYNVTMTLLLRGEDDASVDSQMPEVGVSTTGFDSIGNMPTDAQAK